MLLGRVHQKQLIISGSFPGSIFVQSPQSSKMNKTDVWYKTFPPFPGEINKSLKKNQSLGSKVPEIVQDTFLNVNNIKACGCEVYSTEQTTSNAAPWLGLYAWVGIETPKWETHSTKEMWWKSRINIDASQKQSGWLIQSPSKRQYTFTLISCLQWSSWHPPLSRERT